MGPGPQHILAIHRGQIPVELRDPAWVDVTDLGDAALVHTRRGQRDVEFEALCGKGQGPKQGCGFWVGGAGDGQDEDQSGT